MGLRYVWERWNRNSRQTYRLSWFSGNDSFTVGEPRQCYESYTFDKYTGIVTGVSPCYPWGDEYEGRTVYGLGSVSYLDIDWASSVCSRWGWSPNNAEAATVEEGDPEYSKGSTSYGNIAASSSSKYPNNNYSGTYWYVYKGSDSIDPTAITYSPNPAKGGELVTITITPSTSITYGGTISYKYEYQLDSGSWQVLNNSTSETSVSVVIPKGTTSFTARVTASDNMGFISTPIVGDTITVNNNSNPVINFNSPTTDLGDVTDKSQLNLFFYVTDPDGDAPSVTLKIDDKILIEDFTSSSIDNDRYMYSFYPSDNDFLQLSLGVHQIIIEASDGNGGFATHTISFNKVLYTTTLTLGEPMEADAPITKCTVSIIDNLSSDADFEFLVTNNGFDTTPTWEDMTNYIKNNWNYQFTNQTFTSNKYGFNFKLSVSRGDSNIGGYIQSISGGFE